MSFFDSHAHLTDARFAPDLDDVLARAADSGVEFVTVIASDLDDAEAVVRLARTASRPRLFATAGVHPHVADGFDQAALARLERLAEDETVVAIGETGLDFHYNHAPRDAQTAAFRAQLELAADRGLPVVVHARDADIDAAAIIREYRGRATGVLHCFSSGPQLLDAGLEAGWHVSFSGLITFKKYDGQELVRRVPDDRLLVETDSPYLAPEPKRGKRNEPALLGHTVAKLGEIRGQGTDVVARLTFENALRFYGLPVPS